MSPARRIRIHQPGGHGELRLETFTPREPRHEELLIDVRAVGVNFADCITRMGWYASANQLVGWPITPGFEVAGVDRESGQRVLAVTVFDAYASVLVVPRMQAFPVPAGWSDAEAAGFPTVFLTAWYAINELAHPRAQQTALVHSAAGGVGQALVQLLKLRGCRVFGVVGGAHKLAAVEALGADGVVDKSARDWREAARAFAPRGFDHVFDANGVSTLADSYAVLGPCGKLVVYGFHSMFTKGSDRSNYLKLARKWLRTPRFDPMRLTQENKSVLAFNLSFLGDRMDILARAMREMLGQAAEGKLRPVPVTTLPFARVAEAHAALESGRTTGKLVLTLD